MTSTTGTKRSLNSLESTLVIEIHPSASIIEELIS